MKTRDRYTTVALDIVVVERAFHPHAGFAHTDQWSINPLREQVATGLLPPCLDREGIRARQLNKYQRCPVLASRPCYDVSYKVVSADVCHCSSFLLGASSEFPKFTLPILFLDHPANPCSRREPRSRSLGPCTEHRRSSPSPYHRNTSPMIQRKTHGHLRC